MSIHRYDAVILGAGPAGEAAAGLLADAGLSAAIVEQHLVAGECSYYACMPSKALLRPQALLDEARRVPGVSRAAIGPLDPAAVLERRDEVIHHRRRLLPAVLARGEGDPPATAATAWWSGARGPGRGERAGRGAGGDHRDRIGGGDPADRGTGRAGHLEQPSGHDRRARCRIP